MKELHLLGSVIGIECRVIRLYHAALSRERYGKLS
jgi:hypothetical protein